MSLPPDSGRGNPATSRFDRSNTSYTEFAKEDCPVCGHRGWCAKADDGSAILCRRQAEGATSSHTDKLGAAFHVHALVNSYDRDEAPPVKPLARPTGPRPEAAPAEVCHEVYGAMLEGLTLGSHHREELKLRGLTDDWIERGRYRTLPTRAAPKLAAKLAERFGRDVLLAVPGFIIDTKGGLSMSCVPGLLIPVRNGGHIVALRVKPDKRLDGAPKYLWLSSARHGGPSSGAHCHVPAAPTPEDPTLVRLTEGELKADVAACLSGLTTVSAPGVTNWRLALPVLAGMGYRTVRVAFDMDATTKAVVALATVGCCRTLAAEGYAVEVERWAWSDGKGIDDVLAAGKPVEVLSGDDVTAYLAKLMDGHKFPAGSGANGKTNGEVHAGGFVGFVGAPPQECPVFSGAPRPLTTDLLPVPKFPPELIPQGLRPWLANIAERGCFPLEYPTAAALVAVSSLIGRALAIRPKRRDAWTVVPNLWGAIVGPPGLQKTPAVEETLLPVKRLVAEAIEAHAEALKRAEEDALVAEARAAAAKKKLAEAAKKGASDEVLRGHAAESLAGAVGLPTLGRYIVNDTTVEKLGELLRENPRGLLQFRDELTGWFRSMDRQGHESDRGFYLESWNGNGSYTFDRIGRGTIHIPAVCMSVFGTIQPGPLARYLKGAVVGDDADGFMPRFQLLLYPDPPGRFVNVDEWPDSEAKRRASEIFRWIAAMDAVSLGAEFDEDRGLPFLRFDDAAQPFFYEWREGLENRLRSGSESSLLTCHLSKYRSLMPSLALQFHVIASVGTTHLDPVGLESAERAAAWCELLEAHARRTYQSGVEGDPESAARLAERIKQSLPNPFTYRQVAVKGWSTLDNVEDISKAVGILEDRGWVKVVTVPPGPKGGRPSELVWINPAIRDDGGTTS